MYPSPYRGVVFCTLLILVLYLALVWDQCHQKHAYVRHLKVKALTICLVVGLLKVVAVPNLFCVGRHVCKSAMTRPLKNYRLSAYARLYLMTLVAKEIFHKEKKAEVKGWIWSCTCFCLHFLGCSYVHVDVSVNIARCTYAFCNEWISVGSSTELILVLSMCMKVNVRVLTNSCTHLRIVSIFWCTLHLTEVLFFTLCGF